MSALRKAMASYLRHQDVLRRKSLKLSNVLKLFADRESSNVRLAVTGISEAIVEMEKSRKWMQDRIDIKTKEPLGLYNAICKGVKDDLVIREQAIKREQGKQMALDKIQLQNNGNRTRLSQGQIELAGANHEANHSRIALAETIERFETKKVNDIKSSLQEFLYSQVAYHARQLEILNETMHDLLAVDFEEDVEEICEKVRPTKDNRR